MTETRGLRGIQTRNNALWDQLTGRSEIEEQADTDIRAENDFAWDQMSSASLPAPQAAAAPAPATPEGPAATTTTLSGGTGLPSASSVLTFFRELPRRSLYGGALDASQETVETFGSFLDWVTDAPEDFAQIAILATQPGILQAQQARETAEADTGADVLPSEGLPKPKDVLPGAPDPTTTGGTFARKASQFISAFAGPARALKLAGVGTITAGAIAGGIADGTAFDPAEENLADMMQEFPSLRNPVSEFLSKKKEDSDVLGRLKNVVQGLGVGVAFDGFMHGLRVLKAARTARGVTEMPDVLHGTAPVDKDAFATLGAKGKPLTVIGEKLKAAAGEIVDAPPGVFLAGPEEGKGIFINLARIDTADDVTKIIQTAADLHKGSIDEARRGVQTNEATAALADSMGYTTGDLLQRRAGQPLTAEEALAARRLWTASGEKLLEMARTASNPNAGSVDQFNFRRMMTIHQSIQKEVIGARTETARALQSWRIPAGSGEEQARAVSAMMESYGGDVLSRKFAQKIAQADADGVLTKEMMRVIAERGAGARTYDAFLEVWVNGLLSNPMTHAVNIGSNTMVIGQSIMERAVSSRVARSMGDTDGVVVGEAMQQMIGVAEGLKDVWRMSSKNVRMKAQRVLGREVVDDGVSFSPPGLDYGKIDLPRQGSFTADNLSHLGVGRAGSFKDPRNWLGNTANAVGTLSRTPGTALTLEDQFFKTLGYRMELQALAFRKATREGLQGEALKRRTAEFVSTPDKTLRLEATDAALYQTFTRPLGEAGQSFTRWANKTPGARIVFPFIRTPTNILKYSFGERTPLGLLSSNVRSDLASSGAKGQMARTRMAMGTAAMFTAMDLVYSDQLTGGGPPNKRDRDAMRRQGWQPDSVKIGDRYFSYSRLGGFGEVLALGARLGEYSLWASKEMEDNEEMDELLSAAALSFGEIFINKTYMQGLSNVVEAITDPDRFGKTYIERLAGSAVPAGLAQIQRTIDPHMKEVSGMLESLQSRTPGWGPDLPNVRDLWGREITYRSGLPWIFDAFSPIYSRRENPNAIDTELLRLGMSPEKPSRKISYGPGVNINLENHPWVYDRYVELAGNGVEDPYTGKGLFDSLGMLVEGNYPGLSELYELSSDGPEGGKAQIINGLIARSRIAARARLIGADGREAEFAELASIVQQKRSEQLNALITR